MTTMSDRKPPAPLTDLERVTLLCVAGHVIPASAEHGVPGADDPRIFADITRSIDRDREALRKALQVVDDIAGGMISALSRAEQAKRLAEFRAGHPDLAGVIESVVARCYYRDDRVMASIGMEARPAFPKGYRVEQGDLSLLDPVRARGRIYRDAG
jgi:hypothetical protein